MLLDIHRNVLAGQKGADNQLQPVGLHTMHSTTNADPFLDSSQVSGRKRFTFALSHYIVLPLENCLPLHRGPVSDVTS